MSYKNWFYGAIFHFWIWMSKYSQFFWWTIALGDKTFAEFILRELRNNGEWLLFTSDSHFLSHTHNYFLSFEDFSVLKRLGRAAGWKYGWMDRLEERQGRVFWLEALDVNQYVGREHIAVLCSAVRSGESWIIHFTELDFVCSYAAEVLHKLDCRGIRLPEL